MKTEKKINNSNNSSDFYLKLLNNFYNQRKRKESFKTLRISSSTANINKHSNEIPYSIKPFLCSVPKDVSLHEIFINMMNSSFKINGNKSIYLKMSEEDLEIRNYVLNCIKIFIEKNDIHKKILCSIIFLYDILTIKNKHKKMLNNSEEIGIGACFLTLKFLCTKKKSFYSLKNFSEIFQTEKLSSNDIKEIEIKCLKLIDYYLNYASPISFMEIFFINGIIFSNDKIKEGESGGIYDLIIEIIEKIMLISNEYIKYNPLCLCSCIVSFARELYNIEIWPQILTQAFGVNAYSFRNIYGEFHELIFKKNSKENLKEKTKNHIRKKTQVYKEIEYDKDEMKLHTSSSVVQNITNNYTYRSPIKAEGEGAKKYINIYYNHNYPSNNRIINSELIQKYKKKNILVNKINNYENGIKEKNIKEKRIKEMGIEIPSLNHKKNKSLKYIYETNLEKTENNDIKINKKILYKTKEEDYSNVTTSENSNKNKYKKNFDIHYNNKNGNYLKSEYNEQIKEKKDDSINNNLNENNTISKTSQKKYFYNIPRWSSIKKFYKLKQNMEKETFCHLTDTKALNYKKKYT